MSDPYEAYRAGVRDAVAGLTDTDEIAEAVLRMAKQHMEDITDWLAAQGYGFTFTTEDPLPVVLRIPLAHAYARRDGPEAVEITEYYELLADACGWWEGTGT